jgi:hypothetical protein
MDNKVLVKLLVPEIEKEYDIFLPVNRKIGNIIIMLNKAVNELSKGEYPIADNDGLYNADTKELYEADKQLIKTNIRNGTKLVLLSSQSKKNSSI